MALPDYVFTEGFDKYGPAGYYNFASLMQGDWNLVTDFSLLYSTGIVAPLVTTTGQALLMNTVAGFDYRARNLYKNLPANYARCIGGFTVSHSLGGAGSGVIFYDNTTAQWSLSINTLGQIELRRGDTGATLVATSAQSIVASSATCIEYDFTFHNSTGSYKVWINGVLTSLSATGVDTCAGANNYINRVNLTSGYSTAIYVIYDHLYFWLYSASGGSETPALTNPIVETQFGTSDDTGGWTVGPHAIQNSFDLRTTNTPGANQLMLVQMVAGASGTLSSIVCVPNTTSGTAKFKGVIYADSSGQPGALLATGTEVTGCTAGSNLTLPFSGGPSLTAGTAYWFGLINDTSITFYANNLTTGYRKANTYTSGPPSPAGTGFTTGQTTWNFLGILTGVTTHYTQEDSIIPLDSLEYNYSSTIGQQELYNFPSLANTPTAIYSVAVKARVAKIDSGARTLDLQTKSSSTTSAGNLPGQAAPLSYGLVASYYLTDPATSVAWTGSGVNAAKHGIKVAS